MKHVGIVTLGAVILTSVAIGCARQKTDKQTDDSQGSGLVAVLDDATFDAGIQSGVVLVDFWATWCGPCLKQGPIVEAVAQQVEGKAKVAKLDVDAAPNVAQRFNIASIPTLIVFQGGKPAQQFVGVTKTEPLVAAINAALAAP